MPLTVLCVAEKPSVAKALTEVLSQQPGANTSRRNSISPFNPIHCVTLPSGLITPMGNTGTLELLITSVAGHMYGLDYTGELTRWDQETLGELFTAPVHVTTPEKSKKIVESLQQCARNAQQVWLWLDCDREGEAIAQEVVDTVRPQNNRLVFKRAVFNALNRDQVLGAIRTLRDVNMNEVHAVNVRQELDLRLGAAFSRWQTMLIGKHLIKNKKGVLSYGNCQIPTLKIVVQRYLEHYAFRPCAFWYLELQLSDGSNNNNNNQQQQQQDGGDEESEDDADSIQRYVRNSVRGGGALGDANGGNNRGGNNNNNNNNVPNYRSNNNNTSTAFSWSRRRLFDKQAVEAIYNDLHRLYSANGKNPVLTKAQQKNDVLTTNPLHLLHLQQLQQFLHASNNAPAQQPLPPPPPPTPLPILQQHPDCYQPKKVLVLSSTQTPTSKWRPIPLNTIEFQQFACRKLNLTAHDAMEIAESLYQDGFISYPRTETQCYSRDLEPSLKEMIRNLTQLPYNNNDDNNNNNYVNQNEKDLRDYCLFSRKLLPPNNNNNQQQQQQSLYSFPRSGKSNDNAHPPIYPVKIRGENDLQDPRKRKVYDFIMRHFLATCCRDAIGIKTQATLQCFGGIICDNNNNNENNNNNNNNNNDDLNLMNNNNNNDNLNLPTEYELFYGEGLVVKELNYLEITYWDKWSNKTIPLLQPGQYLNPQDVKIVLKQGSTTGPALHTESSLIAEMHRHGIGTDATMANHINTVRGRGYMFLNSVLPTPLGCAMVLAWSFRSQLLASVKSRAELEKKLNAIADGVVDKEEVLKEQIKIFSQVFNTIRHNLRYKEEIRQILTLGLQNPVQEEVFNTLLRNPGAGENDMFHGGGGGNNNNNDNNNNNSNARGGGARGGRGGAGRGRGRGGGARGGMNDD